MSTCPRRRFLALALSSPLAVLALSREAHAANPTYSTRGTVKWIADDKKRVRIHHDDIPGFMKAMTMPFDVMKPELLAGIAKGDRVAFTFEMQDSGDLVVLAMTKLAGAGASRT